MYQVMCRVFKFVISRCLIPIVIAAIGFNASAGESFRLGGSGTDLETMKLLAETFAAKHAGLEVEILPSLGSGGGVRALKAGRLDLAITSRALKEKELAATIRAYQYAQTPLVFATAIKNPVDNITQQQLKLIYSGQHPYWPDGSVARPILRPQSDSDVMILKKNYPWMNKPLDQAYKRRGIPIATTDQACADKIESVPGAIGTSTLALILSEQRKLKPLKLDGVEPSIESISSGKYILVKDLFLVISTEPSVTTKNFIQFITSKEGISILERTGHRVIGFSL